MRAFIKNTVAQVMIAITAIRASNPNGCGQTIIIRAACGRIRISEDSPLRHGMKHLGDGDKPAALIKRIRKSMTSEDRLTFQLASSGGAAIKFSPEDR